MDRDGVWIESDLIGAIVLRRDVSKSWCSPPRRTRTTLEEQTTLQWNRLRPGEISAIKISRGKHFIGQAFHRAYWHRHGYKRNHGRKKERNKALMKTKKFLKLTQSELRLPISSTLHTPLTCRIMFYRVCDPAFWKVHGGRLFGIEIRIHS